MNVKHEMWWWTFRPSVVFQCEMQAFRESPEQRSKWGCGRSSECILALPAPALPQCVPPGSWSSQLEPLWGRGRKKASNLRDHMAIILNKVWMKIRADQGIIKCPFISNLIPVKYKCLKKATFAVGGFFQVTGALFLKTHISVSHTLFSAITSTN